MPNKADEKKSKNRGLKVMALTAGLVLIGGVAFAYWTTSGSGSGTASTGTTTSAITVNQADLANPLAPGVAAQTLGGTFNNPGTTSVHVSSVALTTPITVTRTAAAIAANLACGPADYNVTGFPVAVSVDLAPAATNAGSWGGAGGPTIVFNNTNANQDGCKGATLTLNYTSN